MFESRHKHRAWASSGLESYPDVARFRHKYDWVISLDVRGRFMILRFALLAIISS